MAGAISEWVAGGGGQVVPSRAWEVEERDLVFGAEELVVSPVRRRLAAGWGVLPEAFGVDPAFTLPPVV